MPLAAHVSHYFEKEYGPLRSICDLSAADTEKLIQREREAETGFNRFACGKDFFDFRKLADDLLVSIYAKKFGRFPERRPFFATLGDADVVGGLYRDPYKIRIPLNALDEGEVTFMCPDHFHLVSLGRVNVKRHFGFQIPDDYCKKSQPYFGKLLEFDELKEQFHSLKIGAFIEERKSANNWYRYVEAQIWANPEELRNRFRDWMEVDPEPWTSGNLSHLQNYKKIRQNRSSQRV